MSETSIRALVAVALRSVHERPLVAWKAIWFSGRFPLPPAGPEALPGGRGMFD